MAETAYTYDVTNDLPGGAVNPSRLADEIRASSIVIALERIDLSGGAKDGVGRYTGGSLDVVFKDALSAGDKTILDGDVMTAPAGGLLAAHDNSASASTPQRTEDGIALTQPQVQTLGWQLCDRDIKLVTCTFGAGSVEDLKVNMTTLAEEPWEECALVDVYKDDGAGGMTPAVDQADADVNGILSVWDYCAKDQTQDPKTQIDYDIRDGGLITDPDIPASECYDHRAYAIGAPDLHTVNSFVRFFDGYLGAQPDGRVEAKSPQAKRMSVQQSLAAGVMRIYVYHPAGAKRTHVLRLVTYRALGTV